MKNKSFQTGLSLIEIMISLLRGAFLLGGVLQIFIGSKQTYRMQENLSRLQENGRLALDLIGRDIRMTGYWGCLSPSTPNVDIAGTNDVDNYTDSNGNVIYTDSIILRGAYSQIPTGTCGDRVSVTPPPPAIPTAPPYYIHPSSMVTYRINNGVLKKNTDDLIEGIENMQILYGVDTGTDKTANYYVTADNVTSTEWPNVVSIRISLLAVTLDDNLTTQPMPYSFNDITTTTTSTPAVTDRKIRRVFTTTIALRNRLP